MLPQSQRRMAYKRRHQCCEGNGSGEGAATSLATATLSAAVAPAAIAVTRLAATLAYRPLRRHRPRCRPRLSVGSALYDVWR